MKTCQYPRCPNPVFSNRFCKSHQYERTDNKWMNKLSNVKEGSKDYYNISLRRRSSIKAVSSVRSNKIVQQKREDELFCAGMWECRLHECNHCGIFLGNEPNMTFFHHILPKSKYPDLRYKPSNIMILCFDHHQEAHANNMPVWYKKLIELKKKEFNL